MATTKSHMPTSLPRSAPESAPESGVNRGSKSSVSAARASVVDKGLKLLSSVRFGIVLLLLLLICCMVGMFIMQQSVEGFRAYYAKLSPATRNLYESLGFFNIYHSWYFTALLALTALSIILSSIDRFPAAWAYIRKPRLNVSPKFIKAQAYHKDVRHASTVEAAADSVTKAWRRSGLRTRVTEENGRVTVFAQRHAWNRLGAYFVHIALLLIFIGGFLTSRYGVGGQMELVPGQGGSAFMVFDTAEQGAPPKRAEMPFKVACTDLRQELIRPEGNLDVMNTIDWLSYIRITDNGKEVPALVHLNAPYDYRGYRFFQSSFMPVGYARQVTLQFTPAAGAANGAVREVTVARGSTADVEGIGRVSYDDFYPDFTVESGTPETASGDYNNPAVRVRVVAPDGKREVAIAQTSQAPTLPLSSAGKTDALGAAKDEIAVVAGNRVTLKSFEKVSQSHTLTVQYDPGRTPVYLGFGLLTLALCMVFFFSHQRVWAVVEPDGNHAKVHFGGNTNRNRPAFEARFNSLVQSVAGGSEQ